MSNDITLKNLQKSINWWTQNVVIKMATIWPNKLSNNEPRNMWANSWNKIITRLTLYHETI
jgi:hypothetical protein